MDAIESGATLTFNGYDIMAGTLMEVMAVQRDAATAREAVRRVGKPGMHIGDAATGMTAVGKMAASDPINGLRPCDGRLVAQMCELKIDDDQLNRVPHLLNYGGHIINLMTPLTGGIGGGPDGVAVVSVVVTIDKDLATDTVGHFDVGAATYGLVLAATSKGLGCVINGQGIMQSAVVRKHANIPEDQVIMTCVAIGYPDPDFVANDVVESIWIDFSNGVGREYLFASSRVRSQDRW